MSNEVNNTLLNKILESIRRENAIIWAGAGVSIQAGFPSGQKLAEIFLHEVPESQKYFFENKTSLMDITEEFIQLNNRKSAIKIVSREFNQTGGESDFHSILSKTPHLKTIITTNYDYLFEREFGSLISKPIIVSKDIQDGLQGKVQFFKVHGDLKNPENMVLTKSDYDNFFLFNQSDLSNWSLVKERLVTKDVIFVGYGLEDSNISVLYQKIKNELQNKSQRAFLIAPNFPDHRIKDLKKKGIEYLDMKGEDFAIKLYENLKENIQHDFENKWISPETYRQFCLHHNLLPTIEASNNGYSFKSMTIAAGEGHGLFNLRLDKNSEQNEALKNFVSGHSNEDVRISVEDLKYFAMLMEGIKVHEIQEGEGEIILQRTPSRNETIDVVFEDGYELLDVPLTSYGSQNLIEIKVKIYSLNITVKLNPKFLKNSSLNLKVVFNHEDYCKSTNEELKVIEIVRRLSSGMKFDIHWKDLIFSKSITNSSLGNSNEKHSLLIEYVQRIEKYFKVRFKEFPMYPSEDELFMINILNEIIQFGEVTIKGGYEISGQFDFVKKSIDALEKSQEPFRVIRVQKSYSESLELFEKTLMINITQIDFFNATVANLKELKSKSTEIVKLKGTSKKVIAS